MLPLGHVGWNAKDEDEDDDDIWEGYCGREREVYCYFLFILM